MTTTSEGTFDDLERFLATLEIPEIFQNLWIQLQNAVPDIRSEATVYFHKDGKNVPSRSYIHAWEGRQASYGRKRIEHYGFSETLEQLRMVDEARALSIQTNLYWGVFFLDETRKRVLGFLYLRESKE